MILLKYGMSVQLKWGNISMNGSEVNPWALLFPPLCCFQQESVKYGDPIIWGSLALVGSSHSIELPRKKKKKDTSSTFLCWASEHHNVSSTNVSLGFSVTFGVYYGWFRRIVTTLWYWIGIVVLTYSLNQTPLVVWFNLGSRCSFREKFSSTSYYFPMVICLIFF